MNRNALRLALLCASIALAPCISFGQESVISIGGVDHDWKIAGPDQRPPSNWTPVAPVLDQVTVIWVEDPANPATALYLSFSAMQIGDQILPQEPSIYYSKRGTPGGWVTPDEEDPVVTLTVFEKSETVLHIEGTFSGSAEYREQPHKVPAEPGERKLISGSFAVDLQKP